MLFQKNFSYGKSQQKNQIFPRASFEKALGWTFF